MPERQLINSIFIHDLNKILVSVECKTPLMFYKGYLKRKIVANFTLNGDILRYSFKTHM